MSLELAFGLAVGIISALCTLFLAVVGWLGVRFTKILDKVVAVQQDQAVTMARVGVKQEELEADVQEVKATLKQLPHVKYN